LERRREIAAQYTEALGSIDDLVLPPAPAGDGAHYDVYQNYELESGRRDTLQGYLREHGVHTAVQWGGKAVHQLRGLGFDVRLPRTERLFQRSLLLPMNTAMSDEDVGYVCTKVRRFYDGGTR
jgi:dTDP-4-amino-4,6-dideoxygalactose transaminase